MSLKVTSGPLPDDAVRLTAEEAVYYQWKQLVHWPERWDVWPYLYGVPALSFMAGFSGLKINKHYRMKLKLRRYGISSTQLAMGLTPAIFTAVPHYLFVSQHLFLDKNQCIVCLQTRAIGVQLFSSVMYPVVMSPLANFMFATRHGTYPLPYWKDYKGLLKLWFSMNKSLAPKMKIYLPIQLIVACFVTYMEAKYLCIIRSKIDNGEVEKVPEMDFL